MPVYPPPLFGVHSVYSLREFFFPLSDMIWLQLCTDFSKADLWECVLLKARSNKSGLKWNGLCMTVLKGVSCTLHVGKLCSVRCDRCQWVWIDFKVLNSPVPFNHFTIARASGTALLHCVWGARSASSFFCLIDWPHGHPPPPPSFTLMVFTTWWLTLCLMWLYCDDFMRTHCRFLGCRMCFSDE